jgi:hypothetical protein
LHFCVSSVLTERLHDCLDAASKSCLGLMCRHIPADASKRIAAVYLNPHISSMRAKRSNRGLNSSCGSCNGLARMVNQSYVVERMAGPALDFAVGRVRRHRSDDRSGGFGSELSVLAGQGIIVKQAAKRPAAGCLHFLVCDVCAHGRNDGLARATVKRTSAVACRLQDASKRCTAIALQQHLIRKRAECRDDRLDGASSAGFGCAVCTVESQCA